MKVTGGCHCRAIRFSAEIDPARVVLCHCTDCQAFTSSAFRVTVPAPVASFRLTGEPPRTYVKTADSGAKRVRAFCAPLQTVCCFVSRASVSRVACDGAGGVYVKCHSR